MSTTTNVEFYERIKELQDRQHGMERKRMGLEQQLNSYIQSDHRLARLKAVRLQNYWKKICEDEKRSQWRNEQLLKDFDRVESHMATLNTRTERLQTMKKQYEEYIEKTYPNWKEKVLHCQRVKQQEDRQRQIQAHIAASPVAPPAGYVSLVDQGQYRISSSMPSAAADLLPGSAHAAVGNSTGPFHVHMGQGYHEGRHLQEPRMSERGLSPGEMMDGQPQRQIYGTGAPHSGSAAPPSGSGWSAGGPGDEYTSRPTPAVQQSNNHVATPAYNSPQHQTRPKEAQGMPSMLRAQREDEVSVEEEKIEAVLTPRRQGGYGDWADPVPRPGPHVVDGNNVADNSQDRQRTDDTDDFDSDMSLPMSGDVQSKPVSGPRSHTHPGTAPTTEQERTQTPDSLYLRPDITLDGLYNLMTAIESELPSTHNPKELYRSEQPGESVKREILQNANRGAMLSHINATSISMVIIDQLSLLVISCEGSCLIPDRILYKVSAAATYDSVRLGIHPICQAFWDRLYEHFLHLLKFNIMKPDEIGATFGPLLISDESPYDAKVKELLTTVMENADPEVIKSPFSTSTFSTLPSPRKKLEETDIKTPHGAAILTREQIAPPVQIDNDSPSEDEEFVAPPDTKPVSGLSLTQTAAYRQLLGDTMSTTQQTVSYEHSDEEFDIEDQLGLGTHNDKSDSYKPPSPAKSIGTKPVEITKPNKEETGPLSPLGGSRVSSPSLGSTGGGYIPSGIETGGKSGPPSFASSGLGPKKGPAFMFDGDSDTDEDIDIVGVGTGSQKDSLKHGQEPDDFDFYG